MSVGIIGVGKLGLVYALAFEQQGLHVWASSYKKEYVESLRKKEIDITEPGIAELLRSSQNITFTVNNHEVINNCDMIYVMVATPSLPEGNYDISAVKDVINDIVDHPGSVENKILIVGSTVNPGDCEELQKLVSGKKIQMVYSPTFAAQGSVYRDITRPTSLLLGTTNDNVAERCQQLFFKIIPENTPVHRLHSTSAEIMKIASNCYNTMCISYFNILGQLFINSGLTHDIPKAERFLSNQKINKANLRFGFGYGGPCFPRDNRSLQHYSEKIGMDFPFAKVNDQFNTQHIDFLTQYLLKENCNNHAFYFPYISYKPGVRIFEESHQLAVCKNLLASGARVFVEPTEFVDSELQHQLEQEYGDRVQFVSLQELENRGHLLYQIDL
jgi:UDPglucose 6-dehydrogenase